MPRSFVKADLSKDSKDITCRDFTSFSKVNIHTEAMFLILSFRETLCSWQVSTKIKGCPFKS